MQRRSFISLLGGAVGWPFAAHAQQKAVPVIGYLDLIRQGPDGSSVTAFRRGLSEAGYVDPGNVRIEYRSAENQIDRLPALAAELVNRNVDMILAGGGPASALAAKQATSTIPVLFAAVGDPIGAGLVASLARPGGNVTGFSILVTELNAKRFDLLSDLVPQAKAIALIVNPNNRLIEGVMPEVQDVARRKGVQLVLLKAASETEIDAAFAALAHSGAGALLVGSDPIFNTRRAQFVSLAARYAIPAIYEFREFVALGGLASYGPSLGHFYHQAGLYAARILNGEKPADLPVQQPSKFELVINLQTAKALGLTVPQPLLARADEVIE
jgi:putative tryptophan/tyrosine transport system substrate-binding protein